MKKLDRSFFQRDTLIVAEELLGKVLVRRIKILSADTKHQSSPAGKNIKARIVETEAYIGIKDKACHARHGKTKRNAPMWGKAGFTYVYLCMGLHHLLNIVTKKEDEPEAVLIRRIEPLTETGKKYKSYGPGNLTRYLDIDRSLNGLDITKLPEIYLLDDGLKIKKDQIEKKPRIGINYAKEYKDKPWRFVLKYDEEK